MRRTDTFSRLIIALLAAAAIAYPVSLLAQSDPGRVIIVESPRLHFGVGLQVMQSVGTFADSVSGGFGAGGHGRYAVDRRGIFSIRGDIGFQVYGNERTRIPFPTAPRVSLEQNTSNSILSYNVGPQLMWPSGPVRPYAHAFVGGSYFATNTSLEGTNNDDAPFASSENFSDNTLSYGAGAGIQFPFRTRRTPVALDVGARYVHNGTALYLKPGSIQDDGNSYTVTPIEGPANFVVYSIGISVGAVRDEPRMR